jgi:YjbE family integral membrane protein
MLIPYLSAIGGVVLVWVVYKLLKLDTSGEAEADQSKQASNLRQALILILAADFMMSIDNVIAVAGSAHGSIFLLIAGLLLSMPLLMTTGGFISMLIDKAKWLVYVGAFAIAFTAARMVFEDKAIEKQFPLGTGLVIAISIGIGVAIPLMFWLFNRAKAKSLA